MRDLEGIKENWEEQVRQVVEKRKEERVEGKIPGRIKRMKRKGGKFDKRLDKVLTGCQSCEG